MNIAQLVLLGLCLAFGCTPLLAQQREDAPGSASSDWIYLDNGTLRLGIIKSAGAGIGYLSRSQSKVNLLNHYDRGRLIQQSYYGDSDGSKWAERPWCLNPVQGGSYRGKIPNLLETKLEGNKFYSKSIPLHWATGQQLDDFVLEQWIELSDEVVKIRFKMTYHGEKTHKPRHQEIPAVFLNPSLAKLCLYQGDKPWQEDKISTVEPGPKNEYFSLPEHWAAYIGEDGQGVGVCVPAASELTCYRVNRNPASDCSYLAPIATFALEPDLAFSYDAYLAIGTAQELREQFRNFAKERER